jgi:hypothetical protein
MQRLHAGSSPFSRVVMSSSAICYSNHYKPGGTAPIGPNRRPFTFTKYILVVFSVLWSGILSPTKASEVVGGEVGVDFEE